MSRLKGAWEELGVCAHQLRASLNHRAARAGAAPQLKRGPVNGGTGPTQAFIIIQIGDEQLDRLCAEAIAPAMSVCGLDPKRVDKHKEVST